MPEQPLMTDEQKLALDQARYLAECGVPVFVAPPDPSSNTGFRLPLGWQRTRADPAAVDAWTPGDALCAVMGHVVDLLDVDPRSGGADSIVQMRKSGLVPRSYGRQSTPSGGTHDFVATLGVRGLDKVFPGVDVKAGNADGVGRGFAFLAPTVRVSKLTGEPATYQWIEKPDLESLLLVGGDDTGEALRALLSVRGSTTEYIGPSYDGPAYASFSIKEQRLADAHVESVVADWRVKWEEALLWEEGETDGRARGWELLSRDCAWALARLAGCPWVGMTDEEAEAAYWAVLPGEVAELPECQKWYPGLVGKARAKPYESPWWSEFIEVDPHADLPDLPGRLEDAHLAPWMAWRGLEGNWCWSRSFGWMTWDGCRWAPRVEEDAVEAVRVAALDVNHRSLDAGADQSRMRELNRLLSAARLGALARLVKGVVAVPGGSFDQQPDMLNVGNGVVDLRTGELLPHDKHLYLTKMTPVEYRAGATHPDWVQTLRCLDDEVADWMQIRFGQAVTGWPTSDDVLPIGQGGGSNGKSTLLAALFSALGEHMTHVPEKLIRASPNDHPTELMTLFGARIAVIDETPEAGQLNVPRLKAMLGTSRMTARSVHKDNVTWTPTHSTFVMTNYVPTVKETDRGTWRRLALVTFDKTFAPDDRFRARMVRGEGGRSEAVLAWVVAGARRWYDNEMVIPPAPPRVAADTGAWRRDTDLVLAYIEDRLEWDADACVLCTDVYEDLNDWLRERRHHPWSSNLVSTRFGGHEAFAEHRVVKTQTRSPAGLVPHPERVSEVPARPVVWKGVRWKTP